MPKLNKLGQRVAEAFCMRTVTRQDAKEDEGYRSKPSTLDNQASASASPEKSTRKEEMNWLNQLQDRGYQSLRESEEKISNKTSLSLAAATSEETNRDLHQIQSKNVFRKHMDALSWLSEAAEDKNEIKISDTNTCITCSLVSYLHINEHSEVQQLVLLSNRHPPCVLNYKHDGDQYMWRISTLHTKRARNFTKIIDLISDQECSLPENKVGSGNIFQKHLLLQNLNSLMSGEIEKTRLDHLIIKPQNQKSPNLVYSCGPVEVTLRPDPSTVEFVLDGDAVSGYFSDSTRDESIQFFKYASVDFESLHKEREQNTVTLKVMWMESPKGVDCLYYWIAGFIELEHFSEGNYGASVFHFKNDKIFKDISIGFQRDTLNNPKLSDKCRAKLTLNSQAFVVSEKMLIANGLQQPGTITPKITNHENKQICFYYHSENEALVIQISEPESPPEVKCHFGTRSTTEKVGLEPTPSRQKRMELEQTRILNMLSEYDEQGETEMRTDDNITAIVSTIVPCSIENGIESVVFLIRGICLPHYKNLGRIEISDNYPGWMTTPRLISNQRLSRELYHEWRKVRNDSLHRGQTEFCSVEIETLERKEFKICVPANCSERSCLTIASRHAILKPDGRKDSFWLHVSHSQTTEAASGGASFDGGRAISNEQQDTTHRVNQTQGHDGSESLSRNEAKETLSPNKSEHYSHEQMFNVLLVTKTLRPDANSESASEEVKEMMHPMNSGDPSALITLASIVMITRVKPAGKNGKHPSIGIADQDLQATFALTINGGFPDIVLPDSLQYSDVLTSISMKVEQFYDQQLANETREIWCREDNQDMAMFRRLSTRPFRYHEIVFKNGEVRFKKAKHDNPLKFESWSHNPKDEKRVYSLLDRQDIAKLETMCAHPGSGPSDMECQEFVANLPKTCQVPTLGIKFSLLPKPNQVGIDGHKGALMHDKVDQSHLRFSRPIDELKRKAFHANLVRKLMDIHLQKQKESTKST